MVSPGSELSNSPLTLPRKSTLHQPVDNFPLIGSLTGSPSQQSRSGVFNPAKPRPSAQDADAEPVSSGGTAAGCQRASVLFAPIEQNPCPQGPQLVHALGEIIPLLHPYQRLPIGPSSPSIEVGQRESESSSFLTSIFCGF